jgi:hypothetical protein
MYIKRSIKKILPDAVTQTIGYALISLRQRRLSRLSLQDAFDEIYKKRMWKQGNSLSGVGSEGPLAQRYIEFVSTYAKKYNLRSLVDAGCGDFSVGSHLVPSFDRCMAFDISPHIIGINREKYASLASRHQVTFSALDMTTATLPPCDLVLIRQVLQHLTNAQIEQILVNLESSKWRRALITEEVHNPDDNQNPNIDLPSHSVGNRVALGSGVFIDRAPFSRPAKRLAVIRKNENETGPLRSGLLVFELTQDGPSAG